MNRFFPWAVALIAVFAVFVDIPKRQFSFPFPPNCPGREDVFIDQHIRRVEEVVREFVRKREALPDPRLLAV